MSRIAELRLLAAGLCHDAGIGVEESANQWAWSPERRVILVDPCDLETMGPTVCAGIVAHEVGHALVSRYVLFDTDDPGGLPMRMLANAVEDPRVEVCMAARYPGVWAWMRDGYHYMAGGRPDYGALPLVLQFAFASAASHYEGWAIAPELRVAQVVRDALDATMDARHRYAEGYLPGMSGPGDDTDVETEYEAQVMPALREPLEVLPSRAEMAVQLCAMRALNHFVERVLPCVRPLWQSDVATVADYLRDHRQLLAGFRGADDEARHAIAAGTIREALRRRVLLPDVECTDELRQAAVEMLRAFIDNKAAERRVELELESRAGGQTKSKGAGRPGHEQPPNHRPSREGASAHAAARAAVAPLIERLVRELDRILAPRARLGERTGYRSGVRADLRAVMNAEARGDGYDRMWIRRTVPDRRRAAFLLLIDLSGSMAGDRIEAALQGTVLFTEALDRLKIPHAVRGFQDETVAFLEFGERLSAGSRALIGEMPLEVSGDRPDGHNRPGVNDDGPCLLEAAHELMAFPAEDRVLLVISDGLPEGAHSNEGDLHRAIATITTEMRSIALVGIGIGPEATCVRDFYPEHAVEESVQGLPSRLSSVLQNAMARSHPAARTRQGAQRATSGRGR